MGLSSGYSIRTAVVAMLLVPLMIATAFADTTSKRELDARLMAAADLVDAMGGRESVVDQINRVIPLQMMSLKKQFPTMSAESRHIIESSLRQEFMTGVDLLLGRIAASYAHRFTTEEMRAMARFNRSEAGRKLREQSDDLQRELREISERWGEEIAKRVGERLQEQMHKPAPLTS
jgi:hypothetical protein